MIATSRIGRSFIIIDRWIYPLNMVNVAKGRFMHYCTVASGIRTFVVLLDNLSKKLYLNELTATYRLEEIEEDSLFNDLYQFLQENGIMTIKKD